MEVGGGCLLSHCSLVFVPNLYVPSFPGGSAGKESACNAGDLSLIPGLGSSHGEGNSYPLQYSGLGNSMDCIIHGVAKSETRLSNFHFLSFLGVQGLWSENLITYFILWVGHLLRLDVMTSFIKYWWIDLCRFFKCWHIWLYNIRKITLVKITMKLTLGTCQAHNQFSSVQFSYSVVSHCLQPHGLQHAKPPCP